MSTRGAIAAVLIYSSLAMAQEPTPTAVDFLGDPLPPGAVARLGTLRFRVAEDIAFLAYSGDGKKLVTQGSKTIAVWNAETGQKLVEFAGDNVGPLAWRPDGRGVMLVTEPDGTKRIGDFTREIPKTVPQQQKEPKKIAKAKPVADDEQISVYAMSPGGKYLIGGRRGHLDRRRSLAVWEIEPSKRLADLRLVRELGPQEGNCHEIFFSPEGKYAGVVSGPGFINPHPKNQYPQPTMTFVLYELATGEVRKSRAIPAPRISADGWLPMDLSANGRFLAYRGQDTTFHLLALDRDQTDAPKEIVDTGQQFAGLSTVAFAGEQVFAGTANQTVFVFDIKTGRGVRPDIQTAGLAYKIALSPDGTRMAVTCGAMIQIFDVAARREISAGAGHTGWLWQARVLKGGDEVLTWGNDSVPRLWQISTGKKLRQFPEIRTSIFEVAPDNTTILAMIDKGLQAFSTATGARVPIPGQLAKATGTIWPGLADGRSVLMGEHGAVTIWEWPEGRPRRRFPLEKNYTGGGASFGPHAATHASALTPDGKCLLTWGHEAADVIVWDAHTGAVKTRLKDDMKALPQRIAFLDEGRSVVLQSNASGGVGPKILFGIWDLHTGRMLRKLESSDDHFDLRLGCRSERLCRRDGGTGRTRPHSHLRSRLRPGSPPVAGTLHRQFRRGVHAGWQPPRHGRPRHDRSRLGLDFLVRRARQESCHSH
jgi:WD40 repeat protein